MQEHRRHRPAHAQNGQARVLGRFLESTRGLEDDDLTARNRKDAARLADRARILDALNTPDSDVNRAHVKAIIVLCILLEDETHSLEENRFDEKVLEYEKRSSSAPRLSTSTNFANAIRTAGTYRIVLDAAWHNDDTISIDESRLLKVLREHLNLTLEDHFLIGACLKRFPKPKYALHTPDEINEARKELQREGLVWSYRDENNRNIDVIPAEVIAVIRKEYAGLELQCVNYRRLLNHDSINLTHLREALQKHRLDRYGNKADLIERLVASDVRPSEVLSSIDRPKLSEMGGYVALKTSGTKQELIDRLITFYDDLTFEERITRDDREVRYSNYELLASRAYSELRAKKLITKDLEIEHQFERATEFLFQVKLCVGCDTARKDTRADGRLPLEDRHTILFDCKSVGGMVNLHDVVDTRFDGYSKERESGMTLAFMVISALHAAVDQARPPVQGPHQLGLALVTAESLKHVAEQWSTASPGKPFPVRLFNRTDLIDKERADFLLSLA